MSRIEQKINADFPDEIRRLGERAPAVRLHFMLAVVK